MNEIVNSAVERYMYAMLPQRDDVLRATEAEAERRNIPIVGPAVGRLLFLLARSINAKTIFEMGSAIGYSTIWWARAVGDGGRVIYTDGSKQNAEEARRNFQKAGVTDRVEVHTGDALEILSEQKNAAFDIIFNDVDKEEYPRVFRLAVPRLRKGGLFVTDNVLWRGEIARAAAAEDTLEPDERTRAILEFNRLVYESRELFPVIVPLRDGVAVALKI